MSVIFECEKPDQLAEATVAAHEQIQAGNCVVFPTDTVYGIGADAFNPQGVETLLATKGRDKKMPPPVLVNSASMLSTLGEDISDDAQKLALSFWPGALTLVVKAQRSLQWDLGETQGTVALRWPHEVLVQKILDTTGPLAVSSANKSGEKPAQTISEAYDQLGENVQVYVDGGKLGSSDEPEVSTIVDATTVPLKVLRQGKISLDQLREVVPTVVA